MVFPPSQGSCKHQGDDRRVSEGQHPKQRASVEPETSILSVSPNALPSTLLPLPSSLTTTVPTLHTNIVGGKGKGLEIGLLPSRFL